MLALPKSWVEYENLDKGDEVLLKVNDKLVVSTKEGYKKEQKDRDEIFSEVKEIKRLLKKEEGDKNED